MDIRTTATNIELKPITKTRINKKFTNLGNKISDAASASIDVREEGTKDPDDRFLVKVELDLGKKKVYGEARGRTVLAAVDKSIDILYSLAKKANEKQSTRQTKGSVTRGTAEILSPKPTKLKKKIIVPSTLEEAAAIAQAQANPLSFFMFIDKESGDLKIIDETNKEIFTVKIP